MRGLFRTSLLCSLGLLAGCQPEVWYFLGFGPETEDVEAEYTGLENQCVAIVVYADSRVLFDYPQAPEQVSAAIAYQMILHVKGIQVVNPNRVIAYQRQNLYWDSKARTELGRELGADRVLLVSLVNYSIRQPGTGLFQARISAEASVYECDKPNAEARVWREGNITVSYPKEQTLGHRGTEDVLFAQMAHHQLADKLAKKFYDHEVRIEDEEKERHQ